MSIKPQDAADWLCSETQSKAGAGLELLLNSIHGCSPQCCHQSNSSPIFPPFSHLSRTPPAAAAGKEAQAARARWDGRESQELVCLSCSVVPRVPAAFSHLQHTWKNRFGFPPALALSWEEQQCCLCWGWGGEGGGSWKAALYPVHTQQFVTVKNHLFLGITILRGEIIASVQHKTSI